MLSYLAYLLDFLMRPCYTLTGNWWLTILLFTLITKVILMPLALWCQKNSIVMVQLMPELNRIKARYFGDRERIGNEQTELYRARHYHPLLSLIPLAVQILILFGLVDVIHTITDGGAPGTAILGMVPATDGGVSWLMPLLAGLSAVVMGFAQNRINPLQREQSRAEKNMTNGLSIGLSFVLGVFVAVGMGFYWVCSNLSSIAVQALCNAIIDPRKRIDYDDLAESRVRLDELNAVGGKGRRRLHDPLARRERADYRRFRGIVGKHIVFYSEGSGFYKYFRGAIEYLMENSDVLVNYVTNDPDDQVFEVARSQPRIRPYYIGPKRTITLMMRMDADIVVTTLEDLETYYIKRSYVRKDIEYVFMFHHMTSTHLTAHKGSYDHYDTLLCVGPHQVRELRRAEELYGTPEKRLVECGYDLLDRDIAEVEREAAEVGAAGGASRPVVLIAPSWQQGCIPDTCIDPMISALLGHGYRIVVRPHPEYTKRYRPRWDALLARWADADADELLFERDFSSDRTVFSADILITDWSSVAYEFSFSTRRPCIFVDTPMKVGNPSWEELAIEPTDISLRNLVGVSIAPDEAGGIDGTVEAMLAQRDEWGERIAGVAADHVFNIGGAAAAAGGYLLESLLGKQRARDEAQETDEDAGKAGERGAGA